MGTRRFGKTATVCATALVALTFSGAAAANNDRADHSLPDVARVSFDAPEHQPEAGGPVEGTMPEGADMVVPEALGTLQQVESRESDDGNTVHEMTYESGQVTAIETSAACTVSHGVYNVPLKSGTWIIGEGWGSVGSGCPRSEELETGLSWEICGAFGCHWQTMDSASTWVDPGGFRKNSVRYSPCDDHERWAVGVQWAWIDRQEVKEIDWFDCR